MKVDRKEIVLVEMDSSDFDLLLSFIKKGSDGIILDEVDSIAAKKLHKDLLKANGISY
jgi:hypothetical protein